MIKFAKLVNKSSIFDDEGDCEDVRMGSILSHSAIFVDCRDNMRERFFPIPLIGYLKKSEKTSNQWFKTYTYYNVSHGTLDCCSDVPIAFHALKPANKLYAVEYFAYNVQIFGVDKYFTENLPKKLKLQEIIKKSDKKSFSKNFEDHLDYHNMTSSEIDEE